MTRQNKKDAQIRLAELEAELERLKRYYPNSRRYIADIEREIDDLRIKVKRVGRSNRELEGGAIYTDISTTSILDRNGHLKQTKGIRL